MSNRRREPAAGSATASADLRIVAADGYSLAASVFSPPSALGAVIVNSATAVPRQFYRHFAAWMMDRGFTVITYDYRGIGGSRPGTLKGFDARMRDWALLDMTSVLDFVVAELAPEKVVAIGHSFGGQAAGLLDNASSIDALVGISSQSGYWAVQGGLEPLRVGFSAAVLMPVLSGALGYFPWKALAGAEDLPKGVALEWARWVRDPRYLLGDETLPVDRYARFDAPVLAYSVDDDNWGTARAVDRMMSVYPSVERRHIVPGAYGLDRVGHMGFFRRGSEALWVEMIDWLNETLEGAFAQSTSPGRAEPRAETS